MEDTTPPSRRHSIVEQFKRNSVAYVSLFIAVSGLLYNTWRNETTEYQRSVREATFVAIKELARYQSLVNNAVYKGGCGNDLDIDAWGHMLALRTLADILPENARSEIDQLDQIWTAHSAELCAPGTSKARRETIDQQIIYPQVQQTSEALVSVVGNLD